MAAAAKIVALSAVLALGLTGEAMACGTAGCTLSSRGDDTRLARGVFQLDVSFRYLDQDRRMWSHGPVEVSGSADPEVLRPRVDYASGLLVPGYHHDWASDGQFMQVDVGYGVTQRLAVIASWPLLTSRTVDHLYVPGGAVANHEHTATPFSRVELETRGAGDAQVSVRYTLGPKVMIGAAVKAPTGDYRQVDETGAIADPMSQPGTGGWAFAGTAQMSSRFPRYGLSWAVGAFAQRSLANPLGYRMGDEAWVTARIGRPVRGPLSANVQLKGYYVGRNVFLGQESVSTGSTAISVAPGLRMALPGKVAVYGNVQLPVFQHVNEGQLGTDAVFQMGVSRRF